MICKKGDVIPPSPFLPFELRGENATENDNCVFPQNTLVQTKRFRLVIQKLCPRNAPQTNFRK
jgi:hypothetical protein